MGRRVEQNFQKRFGDRIAIVYAEEPLQGEERRLHHQRLSESVKAVLTAVLKREPTLEELLGIKPIVMDRKKIAPTGP